MTALVLGSVVLASCGRTSVAHQSAHDDLYADPAAEVYDYANANEYSPYQENAAVNTESYRWYAGDDQYLGGERLDGGYVDDGSLAGDGGFAGDPAARESWTDGSGNTIINNNYYGDVFGADAGFGGGLGYTQRLNMFYRPTVGFGWGSAFYDPFYDPFWDPWGPGLTVGVGFGWGGGWGWNRPWGWNAGWGGGWGWNRPWGWGGGWGWNNPWNNPWAWNAGWGWGGGWGYNPWNPWCPTGVWGNPWGWNTAFYDGGNRYYYGPRGSTATNSTTDPRSTYYSNLGDKPLRTGVVDENGNAVPRNPVSGGVKDRPDANAGLTAEGPGRGSVATERDPIARPGLSPETGPGRAADRMPLRNPVALPDRAGSAATPDRNPVRNPAATPDRAPAAATPNRYPAYRNPVAGPDRAAPGRSAEGPRTIVRDRDGNRYELPAGTRPSAAQAPDRAAPGTRPATRPSTVRPTAPAYTRPNPTRSLEPKRSYASPGGDLRDRVAPSTGGQPSRSSGWFNSGGSRPERATPSRSSSPSRSWSPSNSAPSRSYSPSRSAPSRSSGGFRSSSPSRSTPSRSSGGSRSGGRSPR